MEEGGWRLASQPKVMSLSCEGPPLLELLLC